MNSVIKPLLVMDHNWIATIGPSAGLHGECTQTRRWQWGWPRQWNIWSPLSRKPALPVVLSTMGIGNRALACSPEHRHLCSPVQKESECACQQPTVSSVNASSQSKTHFCHLPQLCLFQCIFFFQIGFMYTHTIPGNVYRFYLWRSVRFVFSLSPVLMLECSSTSWKLVL